MNRNYIFKDASDAFPVLARDILRHGEEVGSRAGRVKELTHVGITLTEPWNRELLIPGRKHNLAAQVAETMWVLSGRNDVAWLSHYLPRAPEFSDDGEVWRGGYGPRLRAWEGMPHGSRTAGQPGPVDQLRHVVETLRRDPLSRQAVISIYDPAIDTEPGKDIPCNNWLSFTSRLGKLDLHVAIRSNDLMWGWSGINAFEWSALQEIVAGMLGISIGSLHFSITSLHLYDRHWARAQQIADNSYPDVSDMPGTRFDAAGLAEWRGYGLDDIESLSRLADMWFEAEEAIRTGNPGAAKMVQEFPEPMLQSWLQVIEHWWSADGEATGSLGLSRLGVSMSMAVKPKKREKSRFHAHHVSLHDDSKFLSYCINLHREKDAAYGDSWKKRGELLSILANIARKVDRLGGSETSDESSADTALDLMIYLAKYRLWLSEEADIKKPSLKYRLGEIESGTLDDVAAVLRAVEHKFPHYRTMLLDERARMEGGLVDMFDELENLATEKRIDRWGLVDEMLMESYLLARSLWETEQWKQGNATRSWNPED